MTAPALDLPQCPECGWAMQDASKAGTFICIGDNCRHFCRVKTRDQIAAERTAKREEQKASHAAWVALCERKGIRV